MEEWRNRSANRAEELENEEEGQAIFNPKLVQRILSDFFFTSPNGLDKKYRVPVHQNGN